MCRVFMLCAFVHLGVHHIGLLPHEIKNKSHSVFMVWQWVTSNEIAERAAFAHAAHAASSAGNCNRFSHFRYT